MRKLLALLILLAAAAIPVAAQTTTVSSTGITDANGIVYNGGTYSITLVNTTGQTPYFQGSPLPQGLQAFNGTLSSAGAFSLSIPSTAFILAGNNGPASLMTWNFSICAQFRSGCFNTNIAVSGATQDVTATLNAVSPTMTFALPPNWPPAATGDCPQANGSLMQWKTSCGSSSGVSSVTGTPPIDVATGTTTPVVSLDAGVSTQGEPVVGGASQPLISSLAYFDASQFAGGDIGAKINACNTAAIAAATANSVPATCDDRALGGTQTLTTAIVIGDGTHYITHIFPDSCRWNATGFTGGTAVVVSHFSLSRIFSLSPNSEGCGIENSTASNGLLAMYATTGSPGFYEVSGVKFSSKGVLTASNAVMLLDGLEDDSLYQDVGVNNYIAGEDGMLFGSRAGNCCSVNIVRPLIYSNNAGGSGIEFRNTGGGGSTSSTHIFGGSIGHSASGTPEIYCHDTVSHGTSFGMTGTYLELNPSSTTPPIQLSGCGHVVMSNVTINSEHSGSTYAAITLDNLAPTSLDLSDIIMYSFTLPATVLSNSNTTNCASTPCLILTDTLGSGDGSLSHYSDNTSWADNLEVTNKAFLPFLTASTFVCTTAGKLLTSTCPGPFNQTIQNNGTPLAQEPAFNIIPGTDITMSCTDTSGVSTNCTVNASGSVGTAWSAITSGANTQTGAFSTTAPWTFSAAGAASTPGLVVSGAPFTGGSSTTNYPQVYLDCTGSTNPTTWSTAGTAFGGNACSGFNGNWIDFHSNGGASTWAVTAAGSTFTAGTFTAGSGQSFTISTRSKIASSADGLWTLSNNAGTSFTRLNFGGTTSSFVGLCSSTTALTVCDASGGTAGTFNSPSIGTGTPGTGAFTALTASTSIGAGGKTPVGIGTPTQIYNTAAVTQTASIGATTMIANPAADENYRFSVYVGQLNTGTTCTTAGSVQVNLIYTDPISGSVYTYVVPLDTSGDTALLSAVPLASATITVANVASGVTQFRAKASTNVQYSTTYTAGSCVAGQAYNIYPVLEAQ